MKTLIMYRESNIFDIFTINANILCNRPVIQAFFSHVYYPPERNHSNLCFDYVFYTSDNKLPDGCSFELVALQTQFFWK